MSRLRVDEIESIDTGAVVPVSRIDLEVRTDLADPAKGAEMVAYQGGTVADKLDEIVSGAVTEPLVDAKVYTHNEDADAHTELRTRIVSEVSSHVTAEADRAEAASDAAFVNADVYPDVASGRAAVADGEQFQVVEGDEIVRYRRDSASSATPVSRLPLVSKPANTTFFERTRNLFDGYEKLELGFTTPDLWYKRAENGRTAVVPIEPNKTYTITVHDLELKNRFKVGVTNSDVNLSAVVNTPVDFTVRNNDGLSQQVFTNTPDGKYLLVFVSSEGKEPRIQVEEGSVPTEYIEPFLIPRELQETTPLAAVRPEETTFFEKTRNLFDGYSDLEVERDSDRFKYREGNQKTAVIPIEHGATYTVKVHDVDLQSRFKVGLSNNPVNVLSLEYVFIDRIVIDNFLMSEVTFTNSDNANYLLVNVSDGAEPRLQIEKSDVATEYVVPYQIGSSFIPEGSGGGGGGSTVVVNPGVYDPRKPFPPRINFAFYEADLRIPLWVDRNGDILGYWGTRLIKSTDDWQTHTEVFNFTDAGVLRSVRDLSNGELLVTTAKSEAKGHIPSCYVSTNYSNPEEPVVFTKVLESGNYDASFRNDWGVNVYDNIVFLSEYGNQSKALKAYISLDYGQTFTTVYDLGVEATSIATAHVHSSCYDPYRNWLWLTIGDSPNSRTLYSRDLGDTWETLDNDALNERGEAYQQVTVFPMPDCILFLSDRSRIDAVPPMPNAVWRLPISGDSTHDLKSADIELAYQMDDAWQLTLIGGMAFKNYNNPNQPTYFSWMRAAGAAPAGLASIMATFDGYNIFKVYESVNNLVGGQGFVSILGPTASGKLIGEIADPSKSPAGRGAYFIGDAPTWV